MKRYSKRYEIKAWKSWQQDDPERFACDTMTEVRYLLDNLPQPIVDVIDHWATVPLIETRRP